MKLEPIKNLFVRENFGLLLLRVSLGVIMIMHGVPKILGGVETLESVGSTLGNLGIRFAPVFWGFMAAFTEVLGGLLLVVGFLFRPACALLGFTMVVASVYHFTHGDDFFTVTSHALSLAFVFFSMLFFGPGKFSVQKR